MAEDLRINSDELRKRMQAGEEFLMIDAAQSVPVQPKRKAA